MYIEKIVYENVGPIRNVHITFPFEENGFPKPIIFVGENGSGKSTILSNIVDAFYEMAGEAFNNARQEEGSNAQQYYKSISPVQITSGQSYMFSFISFKYETSFFYLCKSGNISVESVKEKTNIVTNNINWKDNENYKNTTIGKETAENIWNSNVICYFGPDRYERPVWMGAKYYQSDEYLHLTIQQRIKGYLDKPISVKNVTSANLNWLLDIIADSRPDIINNEGLLSIEHVETSVLLFLGQARKNLETILSKIIGDEVYFALNFRNRNNDRFRVMRKCDNSIIAPTLNSLSTGQIALFNLFAVIVRYADYNDITKSTNLSDINGIVVIDEIELHLHTKLQKEILPELLKLFPKVQFIITTHSPLFLLGMRDVLGEDGFEIYEMPHAEKISVERFSEFSRAYDYIKATQIYQKEIKSIVDSIPQGEKPLVITEGSTDWKHLKAAYENLQSGGMHNDLFDNLDFEFFEYEPPDSAEEAKSRLKMGNNVLCQLCENMAKLPHSVKYIFITDRDEEQTNKKMSIPGAKFKKWGNNVYSFVLPIPPHRAKTPAISIEHYYTDDEIKTKWHNPRTGIDHRLYMGNEFDERGIAQDINKHCEKETKCGSSSIAIIDGSNGEKVTDFSNKNINLALPKSKFAKMVLDKQAPFDKFNFESFVDLFKIIKDIINDSQE